MASSPAVAEVPSVVTDIPPVHALVAQVMGDLGEPELLLASGADEHDFQLRPSQAAAVAGADMVVWIGPELTPWLDSALEARTAEGVVLGLLDAPGTDVRSYEEPTADHEDHGADADHANHDEHDHDEHDHEGHDHEGHDHDGADPHAWLDPGNASVWLDLIAARLSDLDPANAATYAANAKSAQDRIATLDAELEVQLEGVRDRSFVTFHDAYGYFTAHYGLQSKGSLALGDASSPGAKRLAELKAELQAEAVACVFPEVQHEPDLLLQVAEGTGVRIGGALDPVGSSLEPGPGAYEELLRGVTQTLVACLKD